MKANHIIIGAARSGTTTLNSYVSQHSQVNPSLIKEIHFFTIDELFARGESYFHSFFKSRSKKIYHFADTYAFTSRIAPERLKKYNADIKITIILREPIYRAYSNYQYAINNGHQKSNSSFLESLNNEINSPGLDIVSQNNLCHFYGSLYHKHLSYWLKFFPREQLFICTTNQLKETPVELLNSLFKFLNLETFEVNPIKIKNSGMGTRNKTLQQFLLNRNHPARKLFRKIFKSETFRNLIIKSGFIEALYELNKNKNKLPALSPVQQKACEIYFREDLEKLNRDFGIEF